MRRPAYSAVKPQPKRGTAILAVTGHGLEARATEFSRAVVAAALRRHCGPHDHGLGGGVNPPLHRQFAGRAADTLLEAERRSALEFPHLMFPPDRV